MEIPEEVAAEIEEIAPFSSGPTTNVRRVNRRVPINPISPPSAVPVINDEAQKRKRGCLRYLAYGVLAFLALAVIASYMKPDVDIRQAPPPSRNDSNYPHFGGAKSGEPVIDWGIFGMTAVDDMRPPKDLADLTEYTKIFLQNPTMIYQFDMATMQRYADQMESRHMDLRDFYAQIRREGQVHVKDRIEFVGTRKELEAFLAEQKRTGGEAAKGVPETVDTEYGTFTQDGREVFGVYFGKRIADRVRFRHKSEVRDIFILFRSNNPNKKNFPRVGENKDFDAALQEVIDNKWTPYDLYMDFKKNGAQWLPERTEYTETPDEKHARLLRLMRMGDLSEYYLNRTNAGAWIP